MTDMNSHLSWRKSTHSMQAKTCVEVADLPGTMLVRDSKNPHGHVLTVDTPAWAAFVDSVRTGHFA